MGTRLNVASEYKIEYAPCAFFNHLIKETNLKLKELFDLYCHDKTEDYLTFDDYDVFPYSYSVEISKRALKKIINRLNECDGNDPCLVEEDDPTNIYTVEDVRNAFRYIYDNSDSELNYIKLEWF